MFRTNQQGSVLRIYKQLGARATARPRTRPTDTNKDSGEQGGWMDTDTMVLISPSPLYRGCSSEQTQPRNLAAERSDRALLDTAYC